VLRLKALSIAEDSYAQRKNALDSNDHNTKQAFYTQIGDLGKVLEHDIRQAFKSKRLEEHQMMKEPANKDRKGQDYSSLTALRKGNHIFASKTVKMIKQRFVDPEKQYQVKEASDFSDKIEKKLKQNKDSLNKIISTRNIHINPSAYFDRGSVKIREDLLQ